jgi:hypothetical protein
MADISASDLRKLFDEIKSMNRGFGAFNKSFDDRESVFDELVKSMEQDRKDRKRDSEDEKRRRHSERQAKRYDGERKADRVARSFEMLGGGMDGAVRAIKSLSVAILGGFGGGLVNGLTDFSVGLTKTYTELADVGQTFGGDMIQMASEAAKAGMTLDDFAGMLKKSSVTAAAMAKSGTSLPMLAKHVRETASQFGMFGYNIRDLDDITASYAEQLRLSGRVETLGRKSATDQIVELAKNAAGLSTLFGKSRSEIMKTWNDAMQNTQIVAHKMMLSEDQLESFNKGIGVAVQTLASLPGETGKTLAEMAAEGAGAGTAVYSRAGDMFVKAGMGHVIQMMDTMTARIKANPDDKDEATADMMSQLGDAIQQNLPALQAQALAGNEAAAQVIRMGADLKQLQKDGRMTAEAFRKAREAAETQAAFTKVMLNVENAWNAFTGKIKSYLLDRFGQSINRLAEDLTKFSDSPKFKEFMTKIGDMGEEVLKWFGIVFKGDGSVDYEETAKNFAHTLDNIETTISTIGSVLGSVVDHLSGFGDMIKSLIGDKASGIPGLVVGIGGVAAGFMAMKALFSGLTSLAGMMVNAKIVQIMGGSGVTGGNLPGGKKGSMLGKLAKGAGAITAVGTAAEIANAVGGVGAPPSLGDFKNHTGRSFVELLDPGLADLIYGKKPNTPQGTFDPSKAEATPMGEVTGWLRDHTMSLFGATPGAGGDAPVPAVPREQQLSEERERLRRAQERLDQERSQGVTDLSGLEREIARLRESVDRGNQQAAIDAQRVIDQNRRDAQSLNGALSAGP